MSCFQHSLYRDPANDNLYKYMGYHDEVRELNRLVGMNIHDILYRLRNGWKFVPPKNENNE